MWRRQEKTTVTCIACGEEIARADAREYDKYGDRWDRRDKAFEHLCKPCYKQLCHQPRRGLESLLVEVETKSITEQRFVERYYEHVDETAERTDSKREEER